MVEKEIQFTCSDLMLMFCCMAAIACENAAAADGVKLAVVPAAIAATDEGVVGGLRPTREAAVPPGLPELPPLPLRALEVAPPPLLQTLLMVRPLFRVEEEVMYGE